MPSDPHLIESLIQYSLLVAGEEDEYVDRQLGPIHIIKYVYLADLAFARRNAGKTYTGVEWRFYKFGPWSQSVNERIEPALHAIGADRRTFASNYEERDDWVRWSLRDERQLEEKERELPPAITMHLKRDIHNFGKDTPSLLEYVYRTKPMLSAAPGEFLDFSLVAEPTVHVLSAQPALRMAGLSAKKTKKLKERMHALRDELQKRGPRERKLVNPVKNPRYDEVYSQGISWLDDLAGPRLTPSETVAEFSDEVWKSPARKGEDVS